MKVKTKCHLETLTELVETISLTGAAALGLDLIWCLTDLYKSGGGRPDLILIATGLGFSLFVCCKAIYKYHMRLYRMNVHNKLEQKLELNYIKNKRKGFNKTAGKRKGVQNEYSNKTLRSDSTSCRNQ